MFLLGGGGTRDSNCAFPIFFSVMCVSQGLTVSSHAGGSEVVPRLLDALVGAVLVLVVLVLTALVLTAHYPRAHCPRAQITRALLR